jgi:hypothetical protein
MAAASARGWQRASVDGVSGDAPRGVAAACAVGLYGVRGLRLWYGRGGISGGHRNW